MAAATVSRTPEELAAILEADHSTSAPALEAAAMLRHLAANPWDRPMTPAFARALAEDRWNQAVMRPVISTSDSGSEVEVTPEWAQLGATLHDLAAHTVGGEVIAFGMRDLVDSLEDVIRERTIAWATAYMLAEARAGSAA